MLSAQFDVWQQQTSVIQSFSYLSLDLFFFFFWMGDYIILDYVKVLHEQGPFEFFFSVLQLAFLSITDQKPTRLNTANYL